MRPLPLGRESEHELLGVKSAVLGVPVASLAVEGMEVPTDDDPRPVALDCLAAAGAEREVQDRFMEQVFRGEVERSAEGTRRALERIIAEVEE